MPRFIPFLTRFRDHYRPSDAHRLELAPDVFRAGDGEETRLVDLRHGRFYAVGMVGARMLDIAQGEGQKWIGPRIAEEFGVTQDDAARDWNDLRGELCEAGLLRDLSYARDTQVRAPARYQAPHGQGMPAFPGPFRLWILLYTCWFSLRLLGWARTVHWLRRSHPATSSLQEAMSGPDPIVRVDEAVRDLAAGCLLNPECKERAFVAWHVVRRWLGKSARLCVGIKLYPFQAHAWVECEGKYLSDDANRCQEFTIIASYD